MSIQSKRVNHMGLLDIVGKYWTKSKALYVQENVVLKLGTISQLYVEKMYILSKTKLFQSFCSLQFSIHF